jgi:hypothetical protein
MTLRLVAALVKRAHVRVVSQLEATILTPV